MTRGCIIGLFDLFARALNASGPAGMGDRSFMAAKVRTDERAACLLPLFITAAVSPSPLLLLIAHAANLYLHASRAFRRMDEPLVAAAC